MPSLWGEKATFVLFLWVRGLYRLVNDIVKMNQQADEEKQDPQAFMKSGKSHWNTKKIITSDKG